jgi:hypothetical protein
MIMNVKKDSVAQIDESLIKGGYCLEKEKTFLKVVRIRSLGPLVTWNGGRHS